jgi:peroxiredoxin Q/BCP
MNTHMTANNLQLTACVGLPSGVLPRQTIATATSRTSGISSTPWRLANLMYLMLIVSGCHTLEQPRTLLAPGAILPDLSGLDQQGQLHQLSEARGHQTLVYFYPKDDTPGCTKEACAFRDIWNRYRDADVRLFAVSVDSQDSHAQFAAKYTLPFPLIADPESRWAKAFGVPQKFGKDSRVSFLLTPSGQVAKVYPKVDPGVHAAQVLADVQEYKR